MMNNLLPALPSATNGASQMAGLVQRAYHALDQARDDFQRLLVRDQAAAVAAAAAILKYRDVQVEASILVVTAERAIVAHNPPPTNGSNLPNRNRDTNGTTVSPPSSGVANTTRPELYEVSQSVIRDMRKAHDNLTDAQFATAVESARAAHEPLTRAALRRLVAAIRKAAASEPDKPDPDKPPTAAEIAQAKISELEYELREARQRIAHLEQENAWLRSQTADTPLEQQQAFATLTAQLDALKASHHNLQTQHAELQAAHRGAVRRLREIEDAVAND